MNSIINIIKMDMAICKKSMILLTLSMLIAGAGCLFFLTPLLLGLFVVGSTAVVSAIFAVENKSYMEFFYGCFPIRKWEYVVGRSLSCFLIMAIPAIISIVFVQIGTHFSLCQIEDIRIIMEAAGQYQMIIICAMIMIGFIGGANLLLASFAGKIEARELLEVLLLLLEAIVVGIIMFVIQKTLYHGDMEKFMNAFRKLVSDHELLSCILLILTGLIVLMSGTLLSLKMVQRKQI